MVKDYHLDQILLTYCKHMIRHKYQGILIKGKENILNTTSMNIIMTSIFNNICGLGYGNTACLVSKGFVQTDVQFQ